MTINYEYLVYIGYSDILKEDMWYLFRDLSSDNKIYFNRWNYEPFHRGIEHKDIKTITKEQKKFAIKIWYDNYPKIYQKCLNKPSIKQLLKKLNLTPYIFVIVPKYKNDDIYDKAIKPLSCSMAVHRIYLKDGRRIIINFSKPNSYQGWV